MTLPRHQSQPLLLLLHDITPDLHPAGTYAIDLYRDRKVLAMGLTFKMFDSRENATVERVKYRLTIVFRDELDQSVLAKETFLDADFDAMLEWLHTNAIPVLGEGATIRVHEYEFTI